MKYKAKIGATFGEDKAQVFGEELEKIQKMNRGILTPTMVVEEARKKNSPLHSYFEWDKDLAHEKFLLHQARLLINSIEVVVSFNGEEKEIRRYLNVNQDSCDNETTTRVYAVTEKVLSNEELRNQILSQAISEQEYWVERYKTYLELSPIFEAIEKTKTKLKIFI
jgi:hypothetical protein